MYLKSVLLIIGILIVNTGYAAPIDLTKIIDEVKSDSCKCKKQQKLNVCYLDHETYCYGFESPCHYSFDSKYMENSLALKLKDPTNFGINGTVQCEIELKEIKEIPNSTFVSEQGCDMFFVGTFPIDTLRNIATFSNTSVPQPTLNKIKNWSLECEQNLVIVAQEEAVTWGYSVENKNTNPNFPVPGNPLFAIFNRAFGNLDTLNQVGNFQGIFTSIPSSGAEVLANDAVGNPTILLDNATNDLIIGDISFFCSNFGGLLTPGNEIKSDDDIFAANIFAFACKIGEGTEFEQQQVSICPGMTYSLPSGKIVHEEGLYLDTILTLGGCDSITAIKIQLLESNTSKFEYLGCQEDNYNFSINGNNYNQSNPSGFEILENQYGCDSIVEIALEFLPKSQIFIRDTFCAGSGASIEVGGVEFNENFNSGKRVLKNQFGCDSIINIELEFLDLDSSFYSFGVCHGESINVNGKDYYGDTRENIIIEREGKCDSIFTFEIFNFPLPEVIIDSTIFVETNGIYSFDNIIPEGFDIDWTPSLDLSCSNCSNPILRNKTSNVNYLISLNDSNNCVFNYPITVNYNKLPFIPTAFSPNNDGINDNFELFFPNDYNEHVSLKRFQVFDRWGGKVFELNSIKYTELNPKNVLWSGNGVSTGVYTFFLEVIYPNNELKNFKGDISIIK